jgi:PAS domain S-box-containing protein
MINELDRFFAVTGYLPHGYCLSWSEPLLLTYVASDSLIFLAYCSIPVALACFARRRKDFPYRWLLWLFAAFIMSSGATHLMSAIVLWLPLYGLDALIKAATAIISVITAVLLWPLLPQALKLPSPAQLRQAEKALQSEIAGRKRIEEDLGLEEQAAEEALQQERMLMAAIVESTDDAIIAKTLDGVITSWNRGAENMFGYSAEEMLGQSMLRIIPSEYRKDEEDILSTLQHGQLTNHFETERVCKDGSRISVSVTVSPIRDKAGRIVGASKIARDISEKKRAESALAEQEAQYRAVIETTTDGFWVMDEQGRILAVNDAYVRQSGYTREELIKMRVADVEAQESPEEVRKHLDKVRRTGSDLFETRHCTKKGAVWPVEVNFSYWATSGGRFFCFMRDITGRKRAEEEILLLNANLEQRVIERTAELTAANHELDSFAYAVSHDLRAPLRAMSGFSQVLIKDYGDQLQGEAKVYLEQITLASRKMSELVDGLLVLSRSTRGELQRDTVDISALSERLLAELRQNDAGRQLESRVDPGLSAHGDSRMIEIIMRNLLENAWKYTAHAAAPVIRVYSGERNGVVRFCVADNGAGFDMAHANRLFQPFQRLHRQDEFPGIGIGLATVQRIVQRHGGIIEAQGEPGKGAVFCFTLPSMPTDKET